MDIDCCQFPYKGVHKLYCVDVYVYEHKGKFLPLFWVSVGRRDHRLK